MAHIPRLSLSWSYPEAGGAVLTFDKTAWDILETNAKAKGAHAEEMVSVALVQLFGSVLTYSIRQ